MRGKWFGQGADASDRVLPFAANEYVVVEDTLKIRQVLECQWLTTHFTLAVTDWRDERAIVQEISEEFTLEGLGSRMLSVMCAFIELNTYSFSIFSGEIGICRILNPWGRIRGRINLTMIAIPVVRFCE